MNKYNKAKIYKIINPDLPNIIYIGSTITTLKKRLQGHKSQSKKFNKSSKILFSVGEPEIILLETYPCECKKELLIKEQEYINNIVCINKLNSFTSDEEKKERMKEYNINNKEKIKEYFQEYIQKNKEKNKEYFQEYRQKNKEKIKEYKKEYIQKNKEKIKEYFQKNKEILNEKKREKITCVCGSIFRKNDKAQHAKTKKHINYINNML